MKTNRRVKFIHIVLIVAMLLAVSLCVSLLLTNRDLSATRQLIRAIEQEDVAEVRRCLEDGVDPNRTNLPTGWFSVLFEMPIKKPLSTACETGNLEIVSLLISYGATAEYEKDAGRQPLEATVLHYDPDDVEIVTLLLANGADPAIESSAVFDAARMMPKVYDREKTNGTAYPGGYDEETAKGITEIVKLLLGEVSFDLASEDGGLLLIWAAHRGNIVLAEYCLSVGCPVTYRDRSGKTAYDYAVEYGHTELAELVKP